MLKPTLVGRNLSLGYSIGRKKKVILTALDFELLPSQLTCLLGPNGVGKSTLVKAIMGTIKPWDGEICYHEKNINSYSHFELAQARAVVLTEPFQAGNMTVGQLVALGRIPYTGWTGKLARVDLEAIEKAMESTKIQYLCDARLAEISDGQRQKAMIARALAQEGKLLILDEPTAHLDLVNRFEIMHLLREIARDQEKSILVVTHDLEIALETADQFWLLNCGNPLVAGIPEDLVLSGQIDQLLSGDRFYFNLERGRIEQKMPISNLRIEGKTASIFWIQKALIKAGIYRLEGSLKVLEDPFSIRFNEEKSFESLRDLIEFLRDLEQAV